jgi:predicted DNA-binding antitoxin AbrB/MazE fold protein
MLQNFQAIYENGVLRPLEPLALPENQPVWVSVSAVASESSERIAAQRRAIETLDRALSSVPDRSPSDGITASDHDQILYGENE